jgi:hypothetical protein
LFLLTRRILNPLLLVEHLLLSALFFYSFLLSQLQFAFAILQFEAAIKGGGSTAVCSVIFTIGIKRFPKRIVERSSGYALSAREADGIRKTYGSLVPTCVPRRSASRTV